MPGAMKRLSIATAIAACVGVATLPSAASAGPLEDLVGGVQKTVDDTLNSVNGLMGGGNGGGAAPAPAPAPEAGVPPTYVPPAHGTNPHGQGTIGVVDLTPEDAEPLPYDPDGGSEDVVVGRARGEEAGGDYHGHITIVSTFLTGEVLGVDTEEGQTEAGPLDPIQEGILDALCDGSGDQVCLEVLRADSSTDGSGSTNSFAVATAQVGGPTGITAGVAESNGNISDDGDCQTAHGDSSVANANVGGALTADVIESSSDSTSCNDGTDTVEQESRVVNLNDTGLPVPEPGCADGTPDSNFDPLLPQLGAVCNADDENGAQTDVPYGVREALSLFVLDVAGVPLLKATTSGSESHARAPGGGGPECPDPTNPDCPDGDECPDPTNPDCPDGDECPDPSNPDCPDGGDECPDPDNPDCPDSGVIDSDGDGLADNVDDCPFVPGPISNDGCPLSGSGDADDNLAFTGADMGTLSAIGVGVMATGLALMALTDRRRRGNRD